MDAKLLSGLNKRPKWTCGLLFYLNSTKGCQMSLTMLPRLYNKVFQVTANPGVLPKFVTGWWVIELGEYLRSCKAQWCTGNENVEVTYFLDLSFATYLKCVSFSHSHTHCHRNIQQRLSWLQPINIMQVTSLAPCYLVWYKTANGLLGAA